MCDQFLQYLKESMSFQKVCARLHGFQPTQCGEDGEYQVICASKIASKIANEIQHGKKELEKNNLSFTQKTNMF